MACGWNWWNALTNIYWLIMNVRCACWTGCIRACGWTGWNGWSAWANWTCWTWWNGWNGANGWQVIYAYMHWTPETICVNGWAWGCWGCWNGWTDWTAWTNWTDWRKLVYMVSTDLDLARFIATQDEEYLLRLLSSESWIEAVAWSTQALRIIANDTELLSDVLSYTTIVNALISDSTCLWYIAWSHTSMVLVKDNTTIMNALIVDSTALWAISQQDFFDYVLENETFLATCVWSTAWANKVNSIDADDLLEPIYFYTWDLWYDSWTTLSEDDDAMGTLENNTNAMLIIESNDEASSYFRIPPIYQEVEYIQSDNRQCLNTLFVPSDYNYVKLVFDMTPTSFKSSSNYFYWTNTNWRWNSFEYTSASSSYWNVWSSTLIWKLNPNLSTNTKYSFDITYNWNNGWTLIIAWSYNFSVWYTWYLWNDNLIFFSEWLQMNSPSSEKIHFLKIYGWTSDNLLRDFIPCKRKSDDVVWMRDRISKQFFTSSTSTWFIQRCFFFIN